MEKCRQGRGLVDISGKKLGRRDRKKNEESITKNAVGNSKDTNCVKVLEMVEGKIR